MDGLEIQAMRSGSDGSSAGTQSGQHTAVDDPELQGPVSGVRKCELPHSSGMISASGVGHVRRPLGSLARDCYTAQPRGCHSVGCFPVQFIGLLVPSALC